VKTEDGGIYRRNRRHLRSSKEQFELNDPNVEMKYNDRQDDSCARSNETSCENIEHSLVQVIVLLLFVLSHCHLFLYMGDSVRFTQCVCRW
jgi:hypothetical protein